MMHSYEDNYCGVPALTIIAAVPVTITPTAAAPPCAPPPFASPSSVPPTPTPTPGKAWNMM